MKMDFDLEGRLAAPTGNHSDGRIDWHGLRAQLAAGYAARLAMSLENPGEIPLDGGSFDRGSARALSTYGKGGDGGLDPVNPTALADGNSGGDNDATVAGANSAGERG
ncbi:MAG: hypothetical protein WCY29_08850 [Novosphingobium sp.]|jgi:hypothetical protein